MALLYVYLIVAFRLRRVVMIAITVILIIILVLNLLMELANYNLRISERSLRTRECRSQMYLANELKRFNSLVEKTREERYGKWD